MSDDAVLDGLVAEIHAARQAQYDAEAERDEALKLVLGVTYSEEGTHVVLRQLCETRAERDALRATIKEAVALVVAWDEDLYDRAEMWRHVREIA